MDKSLRYHPHFENDVRDAAEWYDDRSPGLGDAFISIVRQSTDSVIADPERYAVTEAGLRYVKLPRFPYVVLFAVMDNELLFLGVLHTARAMDKWRERRSDG